MFDFLMPDYRFLLNSQAVHQPSVLLHGNAFYLGLIARPAEFTIGEALVKKEESVAFIKQSLNPIVSSSTEEKNTSFSGWIQVEFLLHDCCKTVNTKA